MNHGSGTRSCPVRTKAPIQKPKKANKAPPIALETARGAFAEQLPEHVRQLLPNTPRGDRTQARAKLPSITLDSFIRPST